MEEIICQKCGHSSDEHSASGCHHLDWQGEGDKERLVPCSCEQTERQVYNQKGNQ